MKLIITTLIGLHGLIHIMGFVSAFHLVKIPNSPMQISRPWGVLWMLASLLFFIMAAGYVLQWENWSLYASLAIIVSQTLIFKFWRDAKWGTLINVLLAVLLIYNLYFF
ncbi:hypothetical protein QWY93_02845 [Echinicola jeungdonensis]|uniref:Uncharacterized protein n=1 Tax=Echinicola jeungdonensis TaxID=709343 RepID=A0ABV5J0T7_9BACT|nr:hypothetical protein [Echinicola jeungdonensis]MDN3668266.1 hypothetical protein [Echinicola jeungdonensis]